MSEPTDYDAETRTPEEMTVGLLNAVVRNLRERLFRVQLALSELANRSCLCGEEGTCAACVSRAALAAAPGSGEGRELREAAAHMVTYAEEVQAFVRGEAPSLIEGNHNWVKFDIALESLRRALRRGDAEGRK